MKINVYIGIEKDVNLVIIQFMLLKNRGDLFEIKKMLIWNEGEKVFEKWMNICLHYKKMGDDLNIKEKEEQEQEKLKKEAEIRNEKCEIKLTSPGNALYNFGKLLANAAFGQTLMDNQDEQ